MKRSWAIAAPSYRFASALKTRLHLSRARRAKVRAGRSLARTCVRSHASRRPTDRRATYGDRNGDASHRTPRGRDRQHASELRAAEEARRKAGRSAAARLALKKWKPPQRHIRRRLHFTRPEGRREHRAPAPSPWRRPRATPASRSDNPKGLATLPFPDCRSVSKARTTPTSESRSPQTPWNLKSAERARRLFGATIGKPKTAGRPRQGVFGFQIQAERRINHQTRAKALVFFCAPTHLKLVALHSRAHETTVSARLAHDSGRGTPSRGKPLTARLMRPLSRGVRGDSPRSGRSYQPSPSLSYGYRDYDSAHTCAQRHDAPHARPRARPRHAGHQRPAVTRSSGHSRSGVRVQRLYGGQRSVRRARLRIVSASRVDDLLEDRLLRSPPQVRLRRPIRPRSDTARAHRLTRRGILTSPAAIPGSELGMAARARCARSRRACSPAHWRSAPTYQL